MHRGFLLSVDHSRMNSPSPDRRAMCLRRGTKGVLCFVIVYGSLEQHANISISNDDQMSMPDWTRKVLDTKNI